MWVGVGWGGGNTRPEPAPAPAHAAPPFARRSLTPVGDYVRASAQAVPDAVLVLLLAHLPVAHPDPVAVLEELPRGLLAPSGVGQGLGLNPSVRAPVGQHLSGNHGRGPESSPTTDLPLGRTVSGEDVFRKAGKDPNQVLSRRQRPTGCCLSLSGLSRTFIVLSLG